MESDHLTKVFDVAYPKCYIKQCKREKYIFLTFTGLILGLRPANERRGYKVMPSLIDWSQT